MSKLTKIYIYEIIVSIFIVLISFISSAEFSCSSYDFTGNWFIYDGNQKIQVNMNDKLNNYYANDVMTINTELPSDIEHGISLAFFSNHQNVTVSIGDEVIYTFQKNVNTLGKTPGNNWNVVDVPKSHAGKVLSISLMSEYNACSGKVPYFYIGNTFNLVDYIYQRNILFYFLSTILFITGLGAILAWTVMRRTVNIDNAFFYLGLIAVWCGIWTGNETQMPLLLFSNNIIFSHITFLSLMLMPYPFLKFISCVYDMKKFLAARFMRIIAVSNFIIQCILHYLRIFDFREMISVSHGVIALSIFVLSVMTIIKVKNSERSDRPYAHMIAVFILGLGFLLDTFRYYVKDIVYSYDGAVCVRICMFIYILILGCDYIKKLIYLLKASKKAEKLERVAYKDPLTGLGNRSAYLKFINEIPEDQSSEYSVIGLDINNLKHINDTYGHSAGDSYIIFCAGVITKTVGEYGKIYRIGGDEFCVIIHEQDMNQINNAFTQMQKLIDEKKCDFDNQIGIAYGVATFDIHNDKTLHDTLDRADKHMYDNKRLTKSQYKTNE